ncbi:DUF3313 domain-containing protein [Rahnella sp. C60]|uniref:DUF3313 domain-containing protein n=1 Tax=Rahnella perminowiae TaxID=2816244 RepID=UPI001C26DF6D|nr:DUF3313 domain-containing protein [Rahnella perminowiae]MBU9816402.1 DUF3313 domain-containing protein [Rahnella perminowiae]
MKTIKLMQIAAVTGALFLAGCTSHITQTEKYSGFLGDYSGLKEVKTASGNPVLRWIDPAFKKANYSYIKYEPIKFYPEPQPTEQIDKATLQGVLDYANSRMKPALAERMPLTDHAGPRTLIFKGAITGVNTSAEGLQFYEVIPVALVIAGTETATGHRTRDTEVYFEGELIDASTGKPVIKVVRKGFGKQVANDTQKVTANDLKVVVDSLANDTKLFKE